MKFLQKILKKPNSSSSYELTPELIQEVVNNYGEVMFKSAPASGCVADVNELPYPKEIIKKSLLIALKLTTEDRLREHFKSGYLMLADWQENVGNTHQGLNLTNINMSSESENLAKTMLEQEKITEKWKPVVLSEQEKLKQELVDLKLW